MSLQEEIQAILADRSLDYDAKGKKLAKLVTKQELNALLPKKGLDEMMPKGGKGIALKEPLRPSTKNMRTLNLSIHKVYFDAILNGTKPIEFRDWGNEYYQRKCSYVEGGRRYLVPFDALNLFVGRGSNALRATVALKDITCNGVYLMFHVGKVLSTNAKNYRGGK